MFALLPHAKEIVRMDYRMPASVRRAEGLSLLPTTAEPVSTRRRALSLSSYLPAAISVALFREEEKVQKPMYYASRALRGAEERYPPMEKLAFALVTAARKLKPYFQAHTINVLTDKPLRRAMSNPEVAG